MKRWFTLCFLLLYWASAFASNSITEVYDPAKAARVKALKHAKEAAPVVLTAAETDSLTRALQQDRDKTQEWLKSAPTSYLAAVARKDFPATPVLGVGRDPGNDVHINDPEVMPHHLRVVVVGDSFRVEGLDPGAKFVTGTDTLRYAVVGPGTIGIGRFMLRLSHQRHPAIIVFDPNSPRYAEYKGLKYFPPDFKYRFVLPLVPNPIPDTLTVLSTHSQPRQALRAGWFVFKIGGKRCDLEATRLLEPGVGEKDVSVFFRDETTGHETYSVGRYVDPEPLPDGRYVLDFNEAYNPACAFSPHYNCPLPSKDNRLKVDIKAGEMDAHYVH
ncbi:MAG TPA: DUF1684 domain-containing protein [Candidatus Sulfotelmatobacter sp.]|nr:DUF1684 domain-containing protein [Candidatus Sulfotelmatobacter sp.]